MIHVIQVVLSGSAEIPKLFFDEAQAHAAFVECAKECWAQSYPAYCDRTGVNPDSFSSAKAFIKSFDLTDKSRIHYWLVKPEESSLDSSNSLDVPPADSQHGGGPEGYYTLSSSLLPPEEPEESSAKYKTPEWKKYVESIQNRYGGLSREFRLFTRHDWRQEVYSSLTGFEYWEWVAAKIDRYIGKAEQAGYSVSEDSEQPGQYTFKTPDGIVGEISGNSTEEAWCLAGLHCDDVKRQAVGR